ncbi:MAG TPA: DUF1552 domain-containing protein [Polyangiales bacterium]|nr:DUF1552 domain-containing protein [Polyangiales bacterium]
MSLGDPRRISRRSVLRGAGVCLALPLLESLAPRSVVRAQAATKRFIAAYFPNGAAAAHWPARGKGSGASWSLSPILQPLAPLKAKLIAYANLENYSSMSTNKNVQPSHSRLCGSFLTCDDSDRIRKELKVQVANGVSLDQLIAQRMTTPLRSLELGLSTLNSYEDGRDPSLSRSIAWASQTQPLYKQVNPQAVFDRLVASGARDAKAQPSGMDAAGLQRRKQLKLSALDFVLDSASSLSKQLGREDKPKLERFLSSVRDLEQRVGAVSDTMNTVESATCKVGSRPPVAYAVGAKDGYDRGTHAAVMTDLIVMALQCDVTRVISYMLDDARSDFVYSHLTTRKFSVDGSVAGTGKVGGYHGLQHAGDSNDGFATINWWFSTQVAELGQKLDAIPEGDGTLLDHTLIVYGSGMHGGDHTGQPLPLVTLGGGRAGIRTDQLVDFSSNGAGRPLRDLYLTVLNGYFGLGVSSFGSSLTSPQNRMIEEILA